MYAGKMFIPAGLLGAFTIATANIRGRLPKVEITDEYEPIEEGLDKVQMGYGMA